MTITSIATITLASLLLSPAHGNGDTAAVPAKPRPTHAQLAERKSEGRTTVQGTAKLVALESKTIHRRKRDLQGLVNRSTIIARGGYWTIVPKGAVLHVPVGCQARLSDKPSGTLLSWHEFHVRNRGWIHTENIALSDARGDTTLSEAAIDAFRGTSRLVVAVHKGGPISMKVPMGKDYVAALSILPASLPAN